MSEATKVTISTLPKEEQWTDQWDMYEYQGFWYSHEFLSRIISAQENFKAKNTDIVLCSFPKTGTTWLKALTFAISTRHRYYGAVNHDHPLLTHMPHECIPFLEVDLAVLDQDNNFNRDPQLPLLATHVPYTSLPKSIIESLPRGCKIVYVWRDPKDTFISLWYFLNKFMGNVEKKREFSFESEFDRFCQGKSFYGPFWEHVLGFWNASLENPERVLFLKYEDMKKETLFYVKKLGEFLNVPFSEEEENEGVPRKIMELCGFENLSNLEVNKTGKHRAETGFGINNSLYFRKGQVGDWKNHLTKEMTERIDAITKQKFGDSGLHF